VCESRLPSWERLAEHLVERAAASDDRHVMWLNRNVTKHRTDAAGLVPLLREALAGEGSTGERIRR
jgi:hypothetical protein